MKWIIIAAVVAGALLWLSPGTVLAQCGGEHGGHGGGEDGGGHGHQGGGQGTGSGEAMGACQLHGGQVSMTEHHHFECVFHEEGVRVYGYSDEREPLRELDTIKGRVKFVSAEGEQGKVPLKYVAPDKGVGRTQGYLSGLYDLSDVEEGSMTAHFSLHGLPHRDERSVRFQQAVTRSPVVSYVCPMGCEGGLAPDPGTCRTCGMDLQHHVEGGDMQGQEHGGQHGGEGHGGRDRDEGHGGHQGGCGGGNRGAGCGGGH